MNADRLADIKARLEAATPAPWEALVWNASYPDAVVSNFKNLGNGKCSANWIFEVDHMNRDDLNGHGYSEMACNDAALAANAPADLRDLVTALEAAEERIATLEAQRDVLFTIADAVLPSDFVENKKLGEAWRHAYSIGALK